MNDGLCLTLAEVLAFAVMDVFLRVKGRVTDVHDVAAHERLVALEPW